MERLISILLLLCLLSSCHPSGQENAHRLYTVNVDEARKDDFCSMFDKLTYIPLETVEDHEIGKIDRILYQDGKYFIVDGLTNQVMVFNEDGKYYSTIGIIGNGPGEYIQITDVALDRFDGMVKIMDGMQGKIVSYDVDGRFRKETKLAVSPFPLHFCQVGKDMYAFNWERSSNQKEWQYHLSINPEDFSGEIHKYLPYEKPVTLSFSPRVTLQEINGQLLFIPLYSPVVYTVDSLEVKPRYTFDFGDKWVSQEFIDTQWTDPLEFMNKLDNVNFVYYFNLLESGSHICAEFMFQKNKYHLVIDKETDHLFLQQETEASPCPYAERPMCCVGNQFVIPLTPSEYNSMIGEDTAQLPEDNNPILMFATFKKF